MREPTMRDPEVWNVTAPMIGAIPDAPEGAKPRAELLRALVRAHQRLVEHRLHAARTGTSADPRCARTMAAIEERIGQLLSSRGPVAEIRRERTRLVETWVEEAR